MIEIQKMESRTKKLPITKQPTVDIDILEYIYGATWEDIMGDEKLVDLIMNNGYYKTALCEAFGIERMVLVVNGVKWKLQGPPRNIKSQIDTFQGKTKIAVIGAKIINKKLGNINIVTPLKDRSVDDGNRILYQQNMDTIRKDRLEVTKV